MENGDHQPQPGAEARARAIMFWGNLGASLGWVISNLPNSENPIQAKIASAVYETFKNDDSDQP